jgi:ABC-type dipeptide/oligopeptide/nickel transport system ATPase component
MTAPLLDISSLTIRFGATLAVDDISFTLREGEAIGLVGESGSGKSATVLAALRLHPAGTTVSARKLAFRGQDITRLSAGALRDLRGGGIAMIFQDPLTACNPLMRIGKQIAEVLVRHRGLSRSQADLEAISLLAQVGIPEPARRARQFPHEFSGGMRQRVMIAQALAGEPALLMADEPTTALDPTVQAEIVRLIARLRRERGMGLIWVTHDLALMAGIVDRVLVMRSGRIVEDAAVDDLYRAPQHPYTQALLATRPSMDMRAP